MNTLAESILAAAELPRERSESLPAGAYRDPSFAEFEKREIFAKEWISLCHISQLKKPGDFVRVDLADEPLLVIRGKDDAIRVLSRTCRHRGMDVMPTGFGHPDEGNRRVVLCPYHLWSYDLTGKLVGAPEMQQAEGFDRSEVCLHAFRSAIWNGFVFVDLSGQAPPLAERLTDLESRFLGKWDMASAEMVWSAHWDCAFNWKVLVENFMECYHHLGAHRKTLEPFLPAKGCWTEPENPVFSAMHLPLKASMQEEIRAAGHAETPFPVFPGLGLEDCVEWSIYLIYPNGLFFHAPDRFYWYRILPTGPESSSLVTTLFVHPSAMEAPGYQETLEREIQAGIDFHMEDMEMCTATQRGLASAGYAPGRLSHLEETIWQLQRWIAGRIKRSQAG
ncbi:MAG: aromatic ring-hydroxylating dioxygenase subunit alpha [Akkermansiaceae bacterium]|jgi:phenylpropionate dioxygenase-like ring-hydroxylating dioxygenase large terminal subunit|nr:aromatic ring-hydroxylating dioxygenase subunit alpha [Akkermansiaceae bacterium]